ncbi:hypothetical protein MRB53_040552 [Persea americana]|nr:hypothetical protein MRB53_040552 [Persea americana]
MNERMKLLLWMQLFDNNGASGVMYPQAQREQWVSDSATAVDASEELLNQAMEKLQLPSKQPLRPPTPYFIYLGANRDKIKQQLTAVMKTEPSTKQILSETTRQWSALSDSERAIWKQKYNEKLETWKKDIATYESQTKPEAETLTTDMVDTEDPFDSAELRLSDLNGTAPLAAISPLPGGPRLLTSNADICIPPIARDTDFRKMEPAEKGIIKLESAKVQLLKRLQRDPAQQSNPLASPISPVEDLPEGQVDDAELDDDLDLDEEGTDDDLMSAEHAMGEERSDEEGSERDEEDEYDEDDESEEEDDEDDYALPGEDGRGLLTDIPLILGPNEIEVLPMVIMSGIVAPPAADDMDSDYFNTVNYYTIRTHLLLANENGRNLLRELLIFVAAWDLREEELYFKFMVKIMEAILMNALMPFRIHSIQGGFINVPADPAGDASLVPRLTMTADGLITSKAPASLVDSATPRLDVQMVHCLFSEFRQNIVPQICALIFLQGQIRQGYAGLEDFPLNLWDMERMYEGVYQYLEFFAILTDHEQWKAIMAEWEVASELITLLRELEFAIPKAKRPMPTPRQPAQSRPPVQSQETAPADPQTAAQVPLAVERPYDIALPPPMSAGIAASPAGATPATLPPATPLPHAEIAPEEPAEFEWRNLKKLCVLVLSSLVWRNRRLQDQVRARGGIVAILSCCTVDDHNPYIREHAIMCLRFLLENNKENQDVVRKVQAAAEEAQANMRNKDTANKDATQLPPAITVSIDEHTPLPGQEDKKEELNAGKKEDDIKSLLEYLPPGIRVPPEVLSQDGYETYMDAQNRVGLRRRQAGESADVNRRIYL